MAQAAVRRIFVTENCSLEEVEMEQALKFAPRERRLVQIIVDEQRPVARDRSSERTPLNDELRQSRERKRPAAESVFLERGVCAFKVFSRPVSGSGDWIRHASGLMRRQAAEAPATAGPGEAIARCSRTVDLDAHYSRLRAAGVDFGPHFRGLSHLRAGIGEVLGL
jgi:hypothetical protein